MAMGAVPAGWYPDHQDAGLLRWWDGTQWTAHIQPRPVPAPVPPDTPAARTASTAAAAVQPGSGRHERRPERKRDLHAEVDRLRQTLDGIGVAERDQLAAEVTRLRDEVAGLRQEHAELSGAVVPLRAELAALNAQRAQMAPLQAEVQQLQQRRDALSAEMAGLQQLVAEIPGLRAEQAQLSQQLVETRETAILQEAGIYQYRHPLDDAVAYKAKLAGVQARIKDAVKAGTAVRGATNWTVNGSAAAGGKMVREFSKLMLRAYNNEADNAVRSMKPYTLDSSVARLQKARETITRLGGTMNIMVTDTYHRLRVEELELTADYLAKVAEQKDREREERARLREEQIARREYEREQERLRKERAHYQTAITALRDRGDDNGAAQAEAKLTEIQDALDGINRRAANIRAGYVYVISNIGAFGDGHRQDRHDPQAGSHGPDPRTGRRLRPVPLRRPRHGLQRGRGGPGNPPAPPAGRPAAQPGQHAPGVLPRPARRSPRHPPRLDASIVEWVDEPEALEWRQSQQTRRQQDTPEFAR